MNALQHCLLWVLTWLSKLGLRLFLIRQFAYFPADEPSYTLRYVQERSDSQIDDTYVSLTNTHSQAKLTLPTKGGSQLLPTVVRGPTSFINLETRNTKSLYDDAMRFHRISSSITDKDARPYKVEEKEDERLQGRTFTHSRMSRMTDNNRVVKPQTYRKAHKMKLITRTKQVVDFRVPDDLQVEGYYLRTRLRQIIPCLLITPTTRSEYIMIHSHANCPDLGVMLDSYLDLAHNLGINIIGYDYTGFGQATGRPSDLDAIADLEAVYTFVEKELGFKWQHIILYGQSIGSGPSVTLAANPEFPVAGLVIHSGFMSGMRVFIPDLEHTPYDDIFPNIDYIRHVNCMVYIMHGLEDDQVTPLHVSPIMHRQAERMAKHVKNLFALWLVEDGGHNNIETCNIFRRDYFVNLAAFLQEVQAANVLHKSEDLLKLTQANRWSKKIKHLYKQELPYSLETQVDTNVYNSKTLHSSSSDKPIQGKQVTLESLKNSINDDPDSKSFRHSLTKPFLPTYQQQ